MMQQEIFFESRDSLGEQNELGSNFDQSRHEPGTIYWGWKGIRQIIVTEYSKMDVLDNKKSFENQFAERFKFKWQ